MRRQDTHGLWSPSKGWISTEGRLIVGTREELDSSGLADIADWQITPLSTVSVTDYLAERTCSPLRATLSA